VQKKTLIISLMTALTMSSAYAATPTVWTTNFTNVAGATGYIKFNDWGYIGPNGVGANDFQVGSGFDSSRIGQVQHVLTSGPDWKTQDPAAHIQADLYGVYPPDYAVSDLYNASMDSGVNFYKWGYTTVAGSTFNSMQIDKAGNYHVARNDMSFQFYDTFAYHDTTGATPDHTYDTNINFQPYAISDAKGWCGSVLNSNPNGVSQMAGQVTFDFAFDAYLNNDPNPNAIGGGVAIQVVPGFVMRSYGSYEVHWNDGSDTLDYAGSAVMNNTDPLTGLLSNAYQNKVSFLGAGVVPLGVWIRPDNSANGFSVDAVQGADGTTADEVRGDGAVWHFNSFAGYAFLMRADGSRTLEWISPTGHSDYTTTTAAAYTSIGMSVPAPVPAAVWLLGSGLLGLVGMAKRGKRGSV
jgi:hypothetical protein